MKKLTTPPAETRVPGRTYLGGRITQEQLRRYRPALIGAGVVVGALALWGIVALLTPQGPGSGFGRTAPLLLTQPSVQKELDLSEEQLQKVEEVRKKEEDTVAEESKKLSKFDVEQRRDVRSWKVEKTLARILDKEQFTRLRQVYYQQRGTRAWTDPEVAKVLKLSAAQKESLAATQKQLQEDMRAKFRGAVRPADGKAPSPQEIQKQQKEMETMRQAGQEQLLSILNDDQRSQWEEMTGERFKGELRLPGGGGGRRGRPR